MPAISINKLSREAFVPFGEVIMLDGARHYPINQGTTERFHALATTQNEGKNGQVAISLFRAQPRTFPFKVSIMERHPLGSQAFVPMSHDLNDEYLVLVAPPGEFDSEKMRAFLCKGFQGVNYAKGVWHHPLIALDKVSDFIVVDRIGEGNNCDEIQLDTDYWLTEESIATAWAFHI